MIIKQGSTMMLTINRRQMTGFGMFCRGTLFKPASDIDP